jgi:hypothetical protein
VPLSLSQYKALLNNMTIKKINEITIVASSKFSHNFSMNEEFLNFSNTLIISPLLLTNNKKDRTYQRLILRQLGHLTSKTRRFLSPSLGGFGFIETFSLYLKYIA